MAAQGLRRRRPTFSGLEPHLDYRVVDVGQDLELLDLRAQASEALILEVLTAAEDGRVLGLEAPDLVHRTGYRGQLLAAVVLEDPTGMLKGLVGCLEERRPSTVDLWGLPGPGREVLGWCEDRIRVHGGGGRRSGIIAPPGCPGQAPGGY